MSFPLHFESKRGPDTGLEPFLKIPTSFSPVSVNKGKSIYLAPIESPIKLSGHSSRQKYVYIIIYI
jgi:hypothetical protein